MTYREKRHEHTARELRQGTRVRLRAPSPLLRLRSDMGTVVRKDQWADYYVIRLDRPALYHDAEGRVEELTEICEDIDNLEVIPSQD